MRHNTVIAIGCLFVAAPSVHAADYRVTMAQQHDWNGKRGFYLNLEGTGTAPVPLSAMKLVLGVANGSSWRWVAASPAWQLNRDYTIKAVISPTKAQVYLDNVLQGEGSGGFAPQDQEVEAFRSPGWAAGPPAFLSYQKSIALSSSDGRTASSTWDDAGTRPAAVRMYDPQNPRFLAWKTTAGQTLTISAVIRFTSMPGLTANAPFIDRYGQSTHSTWAGKVTSDADLTASIAEETAHSSGWKQQGDTDSFGGYRKAGWSEPGKCFYRVVKRDGRWWLVSPDGNPLFYTGLCTADRAAWEKTPVTGRELLFAELPPRTGPTAQAWALSPWGWNDGVYYVSFYTSNLARKDGADWYARTANTVRDRIRRWGFTGIGKWGDGALPPLPSIAVIYHGDVPNVSQHPDVWDASVRTTFTASLRRQIEPRVLDPTLLGWSVGNENPEIIKKAEVRDILTRSANVPAKRALIDFGVDTLYGGSVPAAASAWGVTVTTREQLYASKPNPSDADVERMRRHYADEYYGFIYTTVKSIDPNHLYFGNWIVPGWWEDEADWSLIAAHCDVIGYDRYARTFSDATLDRLFAQSGKPVLCGEFGFPSFYSGLRGTGVYDAVWSSDDAEAGLLYDTWVRAAADNPYCVGVAFFQYRDQPLTGRGPGGGQTLVIDEHYAFGLVDVTDRPKWDLIDRVRAANLAATALRLASTRTAAPAAPMGGAGAR